MFYSNFRPKGLKKLIVYENFNRLVVLKKHIIFPPGGHLRPVRRGLPVHVGGVGRVPAGDQREGGQGRPQGVRIKKTVGFLREKPFFAVNLLK